MPALKSAYRWLGREPFRPAIAASVAAHALAAVFLAGASAGISPATPLSMPSTLTVNLLPGAAMAADMAATPSDTQADSVVAVTAEPQPEAAPEPEQVLPVTQADPVPAMPLLETASAPVLAQPPAPVASPPSRMARMAAGVPMPELGARPVPSGVAAVQMDLVDAPGAIALLTRGGLLRVTVDESGIVRDVALPKPSKDPLCDAILVSHARRQVFRLTPPPAPGTTAVLELVGTCPGREARPQAAAGDLVP